MAYSASPTHNNTNQWTEGEQACPSNLIQSPLAGWPCVCICTPQLTTLIISPTATIVNCLDIVDLLSVACPLPASSSLRRTKWSLLLTHLHPLLLRTGLISLHHATLSNLFPTLLPHTYHVVICHLPYIYHLGLGLFVSSGPFPLHFPFPASHPSRLAS